VPKTIGVLISGRGTNLQALIDAAGGGRLGGQIAVVISNVESAPGLERARRAGIPTAFRDHRGRRREDFDRVLDARDPGELIEHATLTEAMFETAPIAIDALFIVGDELFGFLFRPENGWGAGGRSERKAETLAARCFEHGLVLYPGTGCASGTEGDLVMIAPPFVVTEGELEELAQVLDRSLTELEL